jgi:hypothetical protein
VEDRPVCHWREVGIPRQQILEHLAGVVEILLSQIDAQPRHSAQNHLAGNAQVRHSACGVARWLRLSTTSCRAAR